MLGCIQNTVPCLEDGSHVDASLQCKRRSLRAVHGWLCVQHYREQHRSMVPAARKPFYADDSVIIANILKTEKEAIERGDRTHAWHAGQTIHFLETARS